jgi:hypothetical protein
MRLSLAEALRLTDLQPGHTYREQVNGRTVEMRVLEDAVSPELAAQVMLQPCADLPFTPTLTIQATPGTLPLPDAPVVPSAEEGEAE